MKTEIIIEGNRLIARFQGYSVNDDTVFFPKSAYKELGMFCKLSDLKYHRDWKSLMLVFEKIERLGNYTKIETPINKSVLHTTYVDIDGDEEFRSSSRSKIEAVWLSVVEFIKWYNKQTHDKGKS